MSKIVTANIVPITADKIRLSALEDAEEITVKIPVKDPEIYTPTIISMEPLMITQETLDHAVEVARKILNMMDKLPATPLSGDLICLALAVLHCK